MWRYVTAWMLIGCLLCLGSAERARSQDVEPAQAARALFERGLAHVDAAQWEQAEKAFREAAQLRDSPVIRFNHAVTLIELGRLLEAKTLLDGLVRDANTSAELRSKVEEWLEKVARRVAKIVVRVEGSTQDATVILDEQALADSQLGTEIALDPGSHTLRFLNAGREVEARNVELTEGGLQVIVLSVTSAPTPEVVATRAVEESQPALVPPSETQRDESKERRGRRLWWGVGGSALIVAAGVVTGIVLASRARGGNNSYEGNFDPPYIPVEVPR